MPISLGKGERCEQSYCGQPSLISPLNLQGTMVVVLILKPEGEGRLLFEDDLWDGSLA
jgi:hypothetical protein